jgi:formylglycine-generating enzyme required for sulfatase activity
LGLGILAAAIAHAAAAQDSAYSPRSQQIPPPDCMNLHHAWEGTTETGCAPSTHQHWLQDITHWRNERRIRIAYDPARYTLPALQWTQSSFMQSQMMVHDRYFYEPVDGRYTVDRYLDDLDKRYGGIDAVLIWSTYPNMGVDDRNQLEMVESMPGGIEGVRQMVADFHRRGVRVLFPMMMWDQGTHQPDNGTEAQPWPDAIAALMKEIGADGINGDTQDGVPLGFSLAAEKIGHPLAFEPEGSPSDEALAWNVMNWGQYDFPFIPMVDRFKWLETRHMVNISDRWNQDKTSDLQFAFFNGVGWESWENVWGIWIGINPRDAEATRRVATLERGVAPFLTSPDWEPLYPMHSYGVYASRWPGLYQTLWTIVNRNPYDVSGQQMEVTDWPGTRYFDLYHGVELKPEMRSQPGNVSGNAGVHQSVSRDKTGAKVFSTVANDYGPGKQTAVLTFDMEANGYGAILATPEEPTPAIKSLMQRMAEMTKKPLADFSHEPTILKQTMVEIPPTAHASDAPQGMIRIPGGSFNFKVQGVEIEGDASNMVDVQYPWEPTPRRFHEHTMEIEPFYIDKFPVTNAQFKQFLDATNYAPKDGINFLRDWPKDASNARRFPQGWDNKPVTWVSLEDARAYAKWADKRLPHEWEWQLSAQGLNSPDINSPAGSAFPWGDDWLPANVPTPATGRTMRGPDAVDAHPQGASPYGVMDLVGNVWQWTDEYADEHTRAAIVRGGSYYQPQGSIWYFPQAYRNDEHGKLLLMAPGYDRSGGIGFRCVKDAE